MRNTAVFTGRLCALSLSLFLCGCTAIHDCKYECSQKIRTCQAWSHFDGCNDECFTADYRRGWKAGYYAVLTGGSGCPPLIAPKRYWQPPVFCEHDPSRRNDWYVGYQDGAACARCQPDHHYLQVWSPCAPVCCNHSQLIAPVPSGMHAPVINPSEDPASAAQPAIPAPEAGQPDAGQVPGAEGTDVPDAFIPRPQKYEQDPTPRVLQPPAGMISFGRPVDEPADDSITAPVPEQSYVMRLVNNASMSRFVSGSGEAGNK